MPRPLVSIIFPGVPSRVDDGAGGYIETPGTPTTWKGDLYRVSANTENTIQAAAGTTVNDIYRRLAFRPGDNAGAFPPAVVNQIVTLPSGKSAIIKRVRSYTRTMQLDIETGAV